MSVRVSFLVVLFFLVCLCLFSEVPDSGGVNLVPQDKHRYWRVGFSSFTGKKLDKENLYLTYSIPLLLREALEGIQSHSFGDNVLIYYKRMVIFDEISSDINKINLLINKRDNLVFSSESKSIKKVKLKEIEAKLKKLRERLNFLRRLAPEEVEVKSKKEIQYVSADNSGRLLEAPLYSPMELANKYSLDLLVWGKVEKIGDIFFLKIRAYERALGKNVFSYVDAGARESIYRGINNAVDGLANVIMGKDWGRLAISVNPGDSAVYVNGKFVGNGDQRIKFIPTGEVNISVSRDGYYRKKVDVKIVKGKETDVSISLNKRTVEKILIKSLPSEASVYVNALWVGKTPVTINSPESVSRITLKKEGFNDYVFSLYPRTKRKSITVKLAKAIVSKEKIEEKKRDAFYNALGYWLITLPVPIFSFGLAVDFKVGQVLSIVNSDVKDARSMSLYSDIMYYAYWGGVFINVSLLINAAVRLVDYIRSVD